MPDIAMLSFFLTSLAYAIRYDQDGRAHHLLISFLAGMAVPIAKYNGLVLVPLLAWLLFTSRRKLAMAAVLAAPLLSFALWNILSSLKYGSAHTAVIASFQRNLAHPPAIILFGVICAVGLGVFPLTAFAFIPRLYRRFRIFWFFLLIAFVALCWVGRGIGYGWISALLFGLAVALFLHVLILTTTGSVRCFIDKDHRSALLGIWICCGLLFQAGLMFSSVRYVLFLGPPIILLVLKNAAESEIRFGRWALVAGNFAFVLALAVGDVLIGNAYRQVMNENVLPVYAGKSAKLYYTGEWGMEYYARRIGGQPLRAVNVNHPDYKAGDVIVIPNTAWPGISAPRLNPGCVAGISVVNHVPPWVLRTIDCRAAANFYGTAISTCDRPTFLPWGFGGGSSEQFRIYRVHDEKATVANQ